MPKVSDLFVKCLENEGVRYVFGVPGEENEDLLFSLEKSSIKFVPTRHEQGAAFMANVWGRLTGKPGVCLSTLGPGATNLVTGIADAYLDKSPMVAITGQTGLDRINRESHQYLDVVNMLRPITKWNASITLPDAVPEIVRKAFKIAEMEKPGATHIELPEDVASQHSDQEPIKVVPVKRPHPDPSAIREAVELLKSCKKPLILAGNGVIRKKASGELRELVGRYHLPVAHTFMAQGAVSDSSPESLHSIGLGFRDIVMDAMDQADLILAVGYDIAEYEPEAWNPRKDKKIIHIDFYPAEVSAHYQPVLEIVADLSASLRLLLEELAQDKASFDGGWYQPIRKRILDDIESYGLGENPGTFSIPGVLNVLRELLKDDDLVISDVGASKIWVARNFPVHCPNCCLISNGLASMGIALPGAIAAALENPKRRVVAVMGDGGFMMTSQELETAKRLGVGFLILIFYDNAYGQISWKQQMRHDHATGTQISNPDFLVYGQSFGIPSFRPRDGKEMRKQLQEALNSHKLCLIAIPINQKELIELPHKLSQPIAI